MSRFPVEHSFVIKIQMIDVATDADGRVTNTERGHSTLDYPFMVIEREENSDSYLNARQECFDLLAGIVKSWRDAIESVKKKAREGA
jgi:hypothetical protein